MYDNYPEVGKTTSQYRTINLTSTPVPILPPPTITKITPLTGTRNTTVTFAITGTNFEPGSTTVEFRNKSTGLINTTLTTVTATRIDGTVNLPGNTVTGSWNIRVVTTDGGEMTELDTFTLTPSSAPQITGIINPKNSLGYLNSTVNFTLTGQYFETESVMGNPQTFLYLTNKTYYNVNTTVLSVNETAIVGYADLPWNLTPSTKQPWVFNVSTVDGGANKVGWPFTIKSNDKPTIGLIKSPSPKVIYLNTTANFTLTGNNFQPDSLSGQSQTFLFLTNKTNYNVNTTVLVVNETVIIGYVNTPSNLTPSSKQPWAFNVSTVDGGANTAGYAITVSQRPAPTLASLNVTSSNRNGTIPLKLTGTNFYPPDGVRDGFTNVSLVHNFNGNTLYLAISSISADGKTIEGTLTLPRDATAGAYDAVVTTVDGGTATKESAFTINYLPAPSNLKINLTTVYKNTNVPFEVTGNNFQTTENGTVVTFQNVYIGLKLNTTLTSVTSMKIKGNFTIPADVSPAACDLVVTTIDGGTTVKANAININNLPLPTLASAPLNVTSAYRNSTVTFTLSGTNFQPDATYVRLYLNPSVTPVNAILTSVSTTKIIGHFTIPYDQPSGKYRLDLSTASGGSVTKLSYFTINPVKQPTYVSISPTTGYENTSYVFTLTGTNFQSMESGGTDVTFWNQYGNKVLQPTIKSINSTQVVGDVAIPNFYNGSWYVNITTGDGGTVCKPAAFTVDKIPAPTFISLTPGSGSRNRTVSYTLKGINFQPGLTTVDLSDPGFGELNTTLYAVSSNQIIGGVSFPSGAPTGIWKLNITTLDGGTTTRASAFTVDKLRPPEITSFTPLTGYRGTNVSYIVNGNYFQSGGRTTVNLSQPGANEIQTTLTAVYSSRIYGTMTIAGGTGTGQWKVNVSTLDGGNSTLINAIRIY